LRKLHFYVHTHWDREWYQPFESFRTQLVHLVKGVVRDLESGTLPPFYMDGQSIIFDDVLAVVPSLEPRLRQLMADKKLSAGPWYVLADQMLVSGESLIRNLRFGLQDLSKIGQPSLVGYCPDTFGHSADLPRILNGFGIESATVWRGVPHLDMGPLFWWHSPDGSKVLAYHLTNGYYQTNVHEIAYADNGTAHGGAERSSTANKLPGTVQNPSDGSASEVLSKLLAYVLPWVDLAPSDNGKACSYNRLINGALLPIGGDHTAPPRDLLQIIDSLNKQLKLENHDLELVPTTLGDFLELVRTSTDKPVTLVQKVEGELRFNQSSAAYNRSYLLPGVLSTRLYLKRANRLAEYKLARLAEPLAAVVTALGLQTYPHQELEHAWKLLLQNSPHDSICGCSVDEVHREMMVRTAKLNNTVDSLMTATGAAVSGLANSSLQAADDPDYNADRLAIINVSGQAVAAPVFTRWSAKPGDLKALSSSENVQVVSHRKSDQLFSGWGIVPYYKDVELVEGWVWPGTVPPLGVKTVAWPDALDVVEVTVAADPESNGHNGPSTDTPAANGTDTREQAEEPFATDALVVEPAKIGRLTTVDPSFKPVTVRSNRMNNGTLEVSIASDGDLKVIQYIEGELPRVYALRHRIRDVGDGGDTYNFDPIPEDKNIRAKAVSVRPGQRGPLVGSLVITYEIEIPERAEPLGPLKLKGDDQAHKITVFKRSKKKVKHRITTEVSLRRGVPIVFFDTQWINESSDHRMEVVFDTGKKVRETYSENHFSLVYRDHDRKGQRWERLPVAPAHEAAVDRFPCQRFFIANNQAFFNTGMPEYAVDDEQVSITMLRAVSWLSKPRLWSRGGGAGPSLHVPEANSFGLNKCSYGWAPLAVASAPVEQPNDSKRPDRFARAYELAELYEGPLWAAATHADLWSRKEASLVHNDNKAIRMVACFAEEFQEKDAAPMHSLILRFLNTTSTPQQCTISLDAGKLAEVRQCDMSGPSANSKQLDSIKSGDRLQVQVQLDKFQLITLQATILANNEDQKLGTFAGSTKASSPQSSSTPAVQTSSNAPAPRSTKRKTAKAGGKKKM
jgi:mannosylglycerate hydrolase